MKASLNSQQLRSLAATARADLMQRVAQERRSVGHHERAGGGEAYPPADRSAGAGRGPYRAEGGHAGQLDLPGAAEAGCQAGGEEDGQHKRAGGGEAHFHAVGGEDGRPQLVGADTGPH